MIIPYEAMKQVSVDPYDLLDALDGAPVIESPGGLIAIEIANESESGGFGICQYRIIPENMVQKITDELSFKHAAAANCSLGCTYTAVEKLGIKTGD
jgi:hypothetical protein